MSTADELAAIGRLVQEAAASKRNVVLLRGELERLSDALNKVAGQINGALQSVKYQDFEDNIQRLPEPSLILSTYTEYCREVERSAELTKRIAALGI